MALKKVDLQATLGLSAQEVAALRGAERKLAPRLLIMTAAFIAVNYIDRTNLALASVELTAALGLTPATYGLGASLFFVTYFLLQVPSQMVMAYIPRQNAWLAFLLVTWGASAAAMAGARTVPQFLALRVLLGVFEAGALPGLWTYLAHFYCKERISVPLSVMMGSLVFSQAVGPLLAAGLLALDGVGKMQGWQYLFLIEGLMAVVLAFGWTAMPQDIDSVKALTPEELAAVHASFASSHRPAKGGNQVAVFLKALTNPAVLALCFVKFTRDVAFYGVTYWTPMIVKSLLGYNAFAPEGTPGARAPSKADSVRVVLLVAVPFAAAGLVQFVNAWHSQRVNERRFHVAATWGFGAVALALLPLALRSFRAGFAVLVFAAVGTYGAEGVAVSHYMSLQGGEKGIGMAIVNSAGALGGFVGPLLIGALRERSGGYELSMLVLGAFLAAATIAVALLDPAWAERWMPRPRPRRPAP